MINKIKRLFEFNVKPRLSKIHGMEMHDEDFDISSSDITFYYADFRKCILNKPNKIDDNGVFYLTYLDSDKIEYNICAVAEFAIVEFEEYLRTKNEDNKAAFENQIKWLVENAVIKDNKLYWYYLYDDPHHKAPWGSGISQGIGISALVRGAALFKDSHLIELAELAANSMIATIDEGGYRYNKGSYQFWIEESGTNSHILNGHIYSLLGFYDLYRATGKEVYNDFFKEGLGSIKKNIVDFDMKYFSTYDGVSGTPANNSYNYIHCVLFEVLYRITGDKFFLGYSRKWSEIYASTYLQVRLTVDIAGGILRSKMKNRNDE
ncbi:MAG: hypothetical protein KDB79_03545 [Acidobacteria bacterium]|nr:hypothetical protein [Acidobacteriota bacterium]